MTENKTPETAPKIDVRMQRVASIICWGLAFGLSLCLFRLGEGAYFPFFFMNIAIWGCAIRAGEIDKEIDQVK